MRRVPPPSTITSSPPVSSANRSPAAAGRTRSSLPSITSTGQRTRPQSSSSGGRGGPSAPRRASTVSTSVVGDICFPHLTVSSIGLVECGSQKTWEKKNCKKSSCPPSSQWYLLYFAQPSVVSSRTSHGYGPWSGLAIRMPFAAIATKPSTVPGWSAAT
jgi:hypothetical protein